MSFEIHTPEGRVIPLKELDKEAMLTLIYQHSIQIVGTNQ
jgi:hypothetical protein